MHRSSALKHIVTPAVGVYKTCFLQSPCQVAVDLHTSTAWPLSSGMCLICCLTKTEDLTDSAAFWIS